jgi:hypothetical protein
VSSSSLLSAAVFCLLSLKELFKLDQGSHFLLVVVVVVVVVVLVGGGGGVGGGFGRGPEAHKVAIKS